jgi:exportin-1
MLDATFEPTLNMINKNFEDYPEHRVAFYNFLHAIVQFCFNGIDRFILENTASYFIAIVALSGPQFKLFMDSIVWGFKHAHRDISETALNTLLELLNQFMNADPRISAAFYQSYFQSMLQDLFYVLTNSFHKSGFKTQTMLLMQLFLMVDNGLSCTLYEGMSNTDFVREYVVDLLHRAFPHLQK